jgi:hypothetical protein
MLYKPSRTITITAVLLFTVISSSLWRGKDTILRGVSYGGGTRSGIDSVTNVRSNVALASNFGFHFDVYLPLAWSIQRVLQGQGHAQVYASTPFGFNFQNVSDELGLYRGHFKGPGDLIDDIRLNPSDGRGIDIVILGTCEVDMRIWHDELLAAWDARGADQKFKLVCIVHHAGDTAWHHQIGPWARRNAIRLLPIAAHVGNAFRQIFENISIAEDVTARTAGFEHIPIDVHVPILDLPGLPQKREPRILSNAVVQGSFSFDRRAYTQIFQELIQCLHEDPEAWGYFPLGDRPSFVANPDLPDPPFKLHLVGSGMMNLPSELQNVVVFHVQLNYDEYYDVMAEMDVCVPAFGPLPDYYTQQASSTVAMCIQTNVPILSVQRVPTAYSYIDDDRVVITYPAVMTEMDAIKALRMRSASQFLASDPSSSGMTMGSNSAVRSAVEKMMREGWIRPKAGFQDFKRGVWAANDLVVKKLLRDL